MSLSRELIVAAKARADAATEAFNSKGLGMTVVAEEDLTYHFDGGGARTLLDFVETAARADVPVMADALLRVLDREAVARAIRDRVRLGPIGPNSAAIIAAGGRVSLTVSEADDAADAVLDVLYGGDGSSSNTERNES